VAWRGVERRGVAWNGVAWPGLACDVKENSYFTPNTEDQQNFELILKVF
jgi:hypothetical protein